MQLPDPIQTYFDADQQDGVSALLGAFALDAVVKDEGHTYFGHDAIGAWWRDAKQKYDHRAAPVALDARDGMLVVRASVTGNFPASPAMLTYTFRLTDDRIAELEITA